MTKELPTKPGAYWWKYKLTSGRVLVEVRIAGRSWCQAIGESSGSTVEDRGGFWSPRLVTCDKLKEAYNEGANDGGGSGGEKEWNRSDTKAEMEGNE